MEKAPAALWLVGFSDILHMFKHQESGRRQTGWGKGDSFTIWIMMESSGS